MDKKLQMTGAAVLAAMALLSGPVLASQSSKNTWRNLAIGSAAVGVLGLANHNSTETVLGAAGAAYSANRYEQDRHHQSQARSRRAARERHLAWLRSHHQGHQG
jgi:hypothetical protein